MEPHARFAREVTETVFGRRLLKLAVAAFVATAGFGPSIEAGGEWKTVVTEAMVGDYYCRFHPAMIAGLIIQRP